MMFYRGVKSLKGNVKIEFEAIKKYVQYTETQEMAKLSDYCELKLIKPQQDCRWMAAVWKLGMDFMWEHSSKNFFPQSCHPFFRSFEQLLINGPLPLLQFLPRNRSQSVLRWSPTSSLTVCSPYFSMCHAPLSMAEPRVFHLSSRQ
jgi:hypothetical protein